jgi:hypothetical protein
MHTTARVTGALWLACIVTSMFGFAMDAGIVVRNGPAATVANLAAHEWRFRLGIAAEVISGLSYLGVTALVYRLLKPVDSSASTAAAFFGVAGVAVGGIGFVGKLAAVVVATSNAALFAISVDQIQALVFFALKLRDQVFSIGMIFFGVQCVLAGMLFARSSLMPTTIGWLLAAGGASYEILAFTSVLQPRVGAGLMLLVMPLALVGEGTTTLWLLVKGIDDAGEHANWGIARQTPRPEVQH